MSTPSLDTLRRLEAAVIERNPLLASRLYPPLPEPKVRRALGRAGVNSGVKLLVALHCWHDGTVLDEELALSRTGWFPGSTQVMLSLEFAIGHFGTIRESATSNRRLAEGVDVYFPLFWDGATDWLAVDLDPQRGPRVMLISLHAQKPFREAYHSVDAFIEDAIRANLERQPLQCFRGGR